MKKPLLLFLSSLLALCSFSAAAATVQVTFNVDDPARVKLDIDYVEQTIVKGDNKFDIEPYTSFKISAADDCFLTKVSRKDGTEISISNNKTASDIVTSALMGWDGEVITIESATADDFRSASLVVNIDDPSLVTLQLKETQTLVKDLVSGANTVKYAPGVEKTLRIYSSAGASKPINKVEVDGEAIVPTGFVYDITLPGTDGPAKTVDVTAAFPDEDRTITFDLDECADGFITKVTRDDAKGEEINFKESPVTVKCGSVVYIHANLDSYKLESFMVNGTSVDFSSPKVVAAIENTTIKVVARKYKDYDVKVIVDKASNVEAAYGKAVSTGTPFELKDGDNFVTVNEKAPLLAFCSSKTGDIVSVKLDGKDVSLSYTGSYPVEAAEGSEVVITSSTIVRDLKAVVYMAVVDPEKAEGTFSSGRLGKIGLSEGYNSIEFYDGDNPFSYQHGHSGAAKVYLDDNEIKYSGFSTKSYDATLADGSVLKIFKGASEAPAKHSLTFSGSAVDDVTVVTDKIKEQTNLSAPVTTFEGTHVAITPKAGKAISVKLDGTPLSAGVDGAYSFVADGDKDIDISSTSGIGSIDGNTAETGNVYNVAGICVLRDANEEAVYTLPAGIYIFNGRKIAVTR